MPELPEVETVVRGLSKYLPGQTIKDVEILSVPSFLWSKDLPNPKVVFGLKVLSLSRRGKGIIIHLSKGYCLLIHLKMTGQLVYVAKDKKTRLNFGHPDPNFIASMPSRHTRCYLTLTKGALYFNDQRKFGWVKLTRDEFLEHDPFIRRLGPEPLTSAFTLDHLTALAKRRARSSIKATLLDQGGFVGVGNIYADEALFEAGIRPNRLGQSLTADELARLFRAIKKVLRLGIRHYGTSISHYKTGEGASGKMQNYLKVYGRSGLPCKVCRTPLIKTRAAGRGTHYCPTCQA